MHRAFMINFSKICIVHAIQRYLVRAFLYTWGFTWILKAEIWTQRSFLLIEQCPGPSSRWDHTSRFLGMELQRAGDSPNSKWRLSWGGTRTTDHRTNAQESNHWAIWSFSKRGWEYRPRVLGLIIATLQILFTQIYKRHGVTLQKYFLLFVYILTH